MVKVSIPMKSTKKLPISFKFILPSKRFKLPLLRKRCPYSEFFWSSFFRIRTKYGEIYLSVLSRNAGKYGPQKLLRRTLFTQCVTIVSFIIICLHCFLFIYIYITYLSHFQELLHQIAFLKKTEQGKIEQW